jgi:hypothetical protein
MLGYLPITSELISIQRSLLSETSSLGMKHGFITAIQRTHTRDGVEASTIASQKKAQNATIGEKSDAGCFLGFM